MKKIIVTNLILLLSLTMAGQTIKSIGGVEDPARVGSVRIDSVKSLSGFVLEITYKSCKEILENNPNATDGIYTIDPDGDGGSDPFDCNCDMTTDGGGWTLVSVHSDDGQSNWTYNNRALFSNNTFIGNINHLNLDYKGPAMVQLDFSDILAVHAPSGVWAAYHNVGDGTGSIGSFIDNTPFPNCPSNATGYTLSAGTLSTNGTSLCNTDLYFNLGDYDGGSTSDCADINRNLYDGSYGPAWSVNVNNGCPGDDPGSSSSLGPGYRNQSTENSAIGFGWGISGNTGDTGTGTNYMKIFVR